MSENGQNAVRGSRLGPLFSGCGRALVSAGAFSFFVNLLMLTGPLFMLQVYDRVLTSRSVPTLVALLLLVAFLFVFVGVLEFVRSRLMTRIARAADEHMSVSALKAVIAHGLNHTRGVGSQPVRDLDAVRQFTAGPGPLTLFDAPWTPVYLGAIFLLHPWLGTFALAGALFLFAIAALNEKLTRDRLTRAAHSTLRSHLMAEEGRRNCDVMRAMGMEQAFQSKWQRLHDDALDLQVKASDRSGDISSTAKAVRLFLQSAMLALGAYLAIHQQITAGTIIAASVILSRALQPVEQAIVHWRSLLDARRAYGRLRQACLILPETGQQVALPEPSGVLEVEDLHVSAPGAQNTILRNIGFALEPGTALGVVGVTGSGKSSLIRTICGVWPAAQGSVRFDGATHDQWSPEAFGRHVGYLPQEVQLFSGTIAENIARMADAPDSDMVVEAARMAQVHDMIVRMPDGYDTVLGDAGLTLSSGQRQRLGLARALYGAPKYVFLDEPNANLDSEGEAALVSAVTDLKRRGSAVVIAAHRPSALQVVDRLMFLKDGVMAALGPRDEILDAVTRARTERRPSPLARSA